MWSAHLPGPAQVRRLQAAGVFGGVGRGVHLEGRAMKTPGVKGTHTYIKGLGGKGWPEIRAAMAPGQQSCFVSRSQGP